MKNTTVPCYTNSQVHHGLDEEVVPVRVSGLVLDAGVLDN